MVAKKVPRADRLRVFDEPCRAEAKESNIPCSKTTCDYHINLKAALNCSIICGDLNMQLSATETANVLGLSVPRILQIQAEALAKLSKKEEVNETRDAYEIERYPVEACIESRGNPQKIRGIHPHAQSDRWIATITHKGMIITKSFRDIGDAREQRLKWEKELAETGKIAGSRPLKKQCQSSIKAGLRKDNNTGFRGVSFNKQLQKFRARIRINGKIKHLGFFSNAEDAAHIWDKAARETWGNGAFQNFRGTIK